MIWCEIKLVQIIRFNIFTQIQMQIFLTSPILATQTFLCENLIFFSSVEKSASQFRVFSSAQKNLLHENVNDAHIFIYGIICFMKNKRITNASQFTMMPMYIK